MTDTQRWDEAQRQWEAAVTAARDEADNDRSDVEAAEAESYEAARDERYEWGGDQ